VVFFVADVEPGASAEGVFVSTTSAADDLSTVSLVLLDFGIAFADAVSSVNLHPISLICFFRHQV